MATVYIALGSNLGDRAETLQAAVGRIGRFLDVTRTSSVYETDPVGGPDQPRYLNAVVGGTTDLSPSQLLTALQVVEDEFGRERPVRNAPRTLDLDILLYDDLVVNQPDIIIPHPRMHERWFVLVPLAEVASDFEHPVFHRSIQALLSLLGEPEGVVPTGFKLR